RKRTRLTFEARDALDIGREHVGQNLDCDVAPKFRVAGAVDLAHSAFAELVEDVIRPESAANHCVFESTYLRSVSLTARPPARRFGTVISSYSREATIPLAPAS